MPSLSAIDQIRNQGFRPQVVGCFIDDKKILFLYKAKHDLWQLPQGGIENNETIAQAFLREMSEELGSKFVESGQSEPVLIGEDLVEFLPEKHGVRELQNDQGQDIPMKGKKYFFVCSPADQQTFNIKNSEFDGWRWVNFDEALSLTNNIYQPGKKRITVKALRLLKDQKLL